MCKNKRNKIDYEITIADKIEVIQDFFDSMSEQKQVYALFEILNNLSPKVISRAVNKTMLADTPFRLKARGARVD